VKKPVQNEFPDLLLDMPQSVPESKENMPSTISMLEEVFKGIGAEPTPPPVQQPTLISEMIPSFLSNQPAPPPSADVSMPHLKGIDIETVRN